MSALPRGSRRLFRLRSVDRDLDEELASYFEHAVEELVAQGWTRAEAQAEAARRFGDRAEYARVLRAIDEGGARRRRLGEMLGALQQSVSWAFRSMARARGLSLGIVLTFALGIGANATMYSIVERLLLRLPPHISHGADLRRLYTQYNSMVDGKLITNAMFTYPEYRELLPARSFSELAGFSSRDVIVGSGEAAEPAVALWASGNFFDLLGVQPLRGRFFTTAEDRVGGPHIAVLSYSYWQRVFGAAPDVIGRTIDFGFGPYTVIGVAPRGFTGVEISRVDFIIPLYVAAGETQGTDWLENRGWSWFEVIGRLKAGVTTEAATAEATSINAHAWAPAVARGEYGNNPRIVVAPLLLSRGPLAGGEVVVARLLLAVSLLVLLIGCVNVANLMLARTIRQTREIAVRLAIGISRTRLVAQILLEGMLLSLVGAVAALAFYKWGGAVVRHALLPDVAWEETGLTRTVLLVVIGVALLAGFLSGIVPAVQAARGELGRMLRQASAGGVTRTTARARTTLSLVQTALSVLLLVGAGLFIRSLNVIQHLDLGIQVDGLYKLMTRPVPGTIKRAELQRAYAVAEQRLARIPGVAAVGLTESFPFLARRTSMPRAEGVDSIRRPSTGSPVIEQVTPGYFAAMGLRVLRGRAFRDTDTETAPRVALVNQSFARWVWGKHDPLGKCLYIGKNETRCSEVVGVVADAVHTELGGLMPIQYYVPLAQKQNDPAPQLFVVRVPKPTPALLRALIREVIAVDPRIRFAMVSSMRESLAPQLRSWTLGATMFTVFGALALIVAALGLYSVLSFDVEQRTRELGLRAALGATRRTLVGTVVLRAVLVTAAGVLIGTVVALSLSTRVQPLLFHVSARDPLTFGSVAVLLLLVATVAGLLPGVRAARIEPTIALRAQ